MQLLILLSLKEKGKLDLNNLLSPPTGFWRLPKLERTALLRPLLAPPLNFTNSNFSRLREMTSPEGYQTRLKESRAMERLCFEQGVKPSPPKLATSTELFLEMQ